MRRLPAFLFLLLTIFAYPARAADKTLERTLREPPASARPVVWWHWVNGNITREGITADLEAMRRHWKKGDAPLPAGLFGPVAVRSLTPAKTSH